MMIGSGSRRGVFRWFVLLSAQVVAWSASTSADAEVIKYEFGGRVDSANAGSGAAPGDRFSGTFTYDLREPNVGIVFEGYKSYQFGSLLGLPFPASSTHTGMSLAVGGQSLISGSPGLGITFHESQLEYPTAPPGLVTPVTSLAIGSADPGAGAINVSLALSNPGRTVFPSFELPAPFDLADFPSAKLTAYSTIYNTPDHAMFQGTIDTLRLVPTPEPTTAALLALAGLGWLARTAIRHRPCPGHRRRA